MTAQKAKIPPAKPTPSGEKSVYRAAKLIAKAERRQSASQDEAWEAVCQSIDDGRPVIAWHGEAAQVICRYDPQDRTM